MKKIKQKQTVGDIEGRNPKQYGACRVREIRVSPRKEVATKPDKSL